MVTRALRNPDGAACLDLAHWQRCTWAAYAICALVYARLDGVTPDLLLLAVMVGEAFPLVAHATALDLAIVTQVLPASVPALDAIDPRERQRLLQQAGEGTADVAWQRQPDGRVRVTALR